MIGVLRLRSSTNPRPRVVFAVLSTVTFPSVIRPTTTSPALKTTMAEEAAAQLLKDKYKLSGIEAINEPVPEGLVFSLFFLLTIRFC